MEMSANRKTVLNWIILLAAVLWSTNCILAQDNSQYSSLDVRVRKFMDEEKGRWHDLNIPYSDGKLLYDIIVKNNYRSALEIGTSTGLSGIWIAWALSKTGGTLVTIEIDEERHRTAIENFKKAGVSQFIDAKLADGHQLVKELKGPFDFIFSDADKDWYKNYFIYSDNLLTPGGCFTAHNVSPPGVAHNGQSEFLDYILQLKNYETTVNSTGAGLSISYKNKDK
jgi:caffeoyl-CoA O-methyltransferase